MSDDILDEDEELKATLAELGGGGNPLKSELPKNGKKTKPKKVAEPKPEPPKALTVPDVPESARGELVADQAVEQLLSRFGIVADDVLSNYRCDRAQIEKTIIHLENLVLGKGPSVPRVFVEMLVAALRTKVETNTNAVKLLDSVAKLISAGKGTQIFVQQGSAVHEDLQKILDAPDYPDESHEQD